MNPALDVAIIGAGIIGLATAMELITTCPGIRVAVFEKEERPGMHQTGHNSGVIHSGIYYRPGSFKASMCVSGSRKLIRFCKEHGVPFKICGKLVVAVRESEIPGLYELYRRGMENGVEGVSLAGPSEARIVEPHANCLEALWVPTTGIVDFRRVSEEYSRVFEGHGGQVHLGTRVNGIREDGDGVHLDTGSGRFYSRLAINCGGLHSDRIASMAGLIPPCTIVPFRGEYYRVRQDGARLVKGLIYPVPDPRFPFLGVHFTRMIDGRVEAGPNAVLALAREGYSRLSFSLRDTMEIIRFPGFLRMARRYWRAGAAEMVRSASARLFSKALARLVPEIRREDLEFGGAGVRAQAVSPQGALLDDFVILKKGRSVHVLNAPSPAATSSLAIAEHIVGVVAPLI